MEKEVVERSASAGAGAGPSFGVTPLGPKERAALERVLPARLAALVEAHRGLEGFDPSALGSRYQLYTGRGPSVGSLHIGHLVGLWVTIALQAAAGPGSRVFFMLADDEKMYRDGIDADTMAANVHSTIAQLQGLGFTPETTHFHINSHGLTPEQNKVLIRLLSLVNVNQLEHVFGPKPTLGEYLYPLLQILPCFLDPSKQALVVAGRDQDPFFRLAHAVAKRMGCRPPILLYTRSVPGLDGALHKMSTAVPASRPIYLTDTPAEVVFKVGKVRRVGASDLESLFAHGADLGRDTLYELATLFETDPGHLALITKAYTRGMTATDPGEELETVTVLAGGPSGVMTRDGKTMLLCQGMRAYVAHLLTTIIARSRVC